MGTVAEKLSYLYETKNAIKQAIESKGAAVGNAPFRDYVDRILALPTPPTENPYVRPADWLPIPEIAEDEEVIYLLMGVFETRPSRFSNALTISITTLDGTQWQIDYGDGTTDSINSGGTSSKAYTYQNIPESAACSRGYRQVLMKVTAPGGIKEATLGGNYAYNSPLLQLAANLPNCIKLNLGTGNSNYCQHLMLEIADIRKHRIINMDYLFGYCTNLQYIPSLDMSHVVSIACIFLNCWALRMLPPLDTSMVINMNSALEYCRSLETVPPLDTSHVSTCSCAFRYCYALKTLPPLDFSSATNVSSIFDYCYNLENCTLLHLFANINLDNTFLSHEALVENVFKNLEVCTGRTLTLPPSVPLYRLTTEEQKLATDKGWTLK